MVTVGLSLVDAVLVLAVLVVVPLAVPLVRGAPPRAAPSSLAAGALAGAGLVLRPADGPLAGILTVPWVAATALAALLVLARWRDRGWHRRDLVPVLACGYLAFGALWLLADRVGFEPAGFGPPFVQLTAAHFTYAGFVTLVLADRVLAWRPDDRAAALAVVTVAGAPPLVAVGFVAVGLLQVVGAVLLTVGTYALAWVTLRHVLATVPRWAAWLLGLSSVSVLAPMVLAVQWAVGNVVGTPALSIPMMAATHGVANAVGFCLLGVLGWRLVTRTAASDDGGDG